MMPRSRSPDAAPCPPRVRARPVLKSGLLAGTLLLAACADDAADPGARSTQEQGASQAASSSATATGAPTAGTARARWYARDRVDRGAGLFAASCAGCHGTDAQGTFAWRKKGEDGKFPPPPLNGTAHAWHHPLLALASQIKFGASGGRGNMPGFAGTLSDEQVLDVIAWIQSRWPDEIYSQWQNIEMRSRASNTNR